jgi:hypothetical protein
MKKILTTLLLVTSLCGVGLAVEMRDSNLSSNGKAISTFGSTLRPSLLQRNNRRRWRRRSARRNWNNGRWNNRRGNDRRWNMRRGRRRSGHDMD